MFRWPHVREIWAAYLTKFVARYGGMKIERARDLFEQVTRGRMAPVALASHNKPPLSPLAFLFLGLASVWMASRPRKRRHFICFTPSLKKNMASFAMQ